MTVGTHVVSVSPVPPAAINTNPFMSSNATGWQAAPFEDAVTWADGRVVQARGGSLHPAQAGPVVSRLPGDVTYRVRVRLTKGTAGDVTIGFHVGDSANAVYGGPYWQAGHAESMMHTWPSRKSRSTATYVWDFTVPAAWHPEYPYIGPVVVTPYVAAGGPVQYVDSVELLAVPESVADISCLVDEVSLVHGRADTTSQPDPSAATVDVTIGPGAPLPAEVDIGSWLTVDTVVAGNTYRRFTGRVTDVDIGWDDAGTETPEAGVGRLMAVSVLADYTRRVVGAEPFPQELDGARVARVFALAGLVLDDSDPGTLQVVPRDIDARAALEVAQGTANSAGGLVWETTGGAIRYADSEHRRGAAMSVELDACDILVTPTWNRTVSGLVNDVVMAYGVAPEGGQTPVLHMVNQPSKDRWGPYGYSVTTEIATALDASEAAGLILAQNSSPVWMLNSLPVDMAGLDADDTAAVLGLDVHALVGITNLPYAGSAPTNVMAWVEGWTERLSWGVHEIELTVSDYCRTAPPPRWDDVPAGTTWDDAVGTWDAWACWGPDGLPPEAAVAEAVAEAGDVAGDVAVSV